MPELNIDNKEKTKKTFMETRSYPFEVRSVEEDTPKIVGYAAVYNQLSEDLGGFREKIKRGFFTDAIGRDDVRALFNHDDNFVLGRTKSGTLALDEDSKGLKVEITPPDTSYARDLMNLIGRGDVDQMSFQFEVATDEWDTSDLNNVIRTLTKIKSLWDISPVTFPAYPQTKAGIRSAREVFINYLEEYLKEHPDETKQTEQKSVDEKWQERIFIARQRLVLLKKEI
jgi:HK97 family phage prohead protease